PAPEAPAPLLRRGLLVRHLCLPGRRRDSLEVLRILSETVPPDGIVLSLMSQYTPDFYSGSDRALHRRLTTFEYDSVVGAACDLGFSGYMQSPGSADSGYTPYFPDRLTVSLTAGL
ncbi:MAG: radical SAM protein, partial [Clostridia bacterium]|nr:radical SAM protein [Clostridia bacterium]